MMNIFMALIQDDQDPKNWLWVMRLMYIVLEFLVSWNPKRMRRFRLREKVDMCS